MNNEVRKLKIIIESQLHEMKNAQEKIDDLNSQLTQQEELMNELWASFKESIKVNNHIKSKTHDAEERACDLKSTLSLYLPHHEAML